jgi:hypothetical protein
MYLIIHIPEYQYFVEAPLAQICGEIFQINGERLRFPHNNPTLLFIITIMELVNNKRRGDHWGEGSPGPGRQAFHRHYSFNGMQAVGFITKAEY